MAIVIKTRRRQPRDWHNPDVFCKYSQKVIFRSHAVILATARIVLIAGIAGCDLLGRSAAAPPARSPAPPLTPAITEAEAKRVLAQHMLTMNLAQRRLSVTTAARAETGSALEMRKAQYKIFKVNKLSAYTFKFTTAWGASPKVSGYPRWFLIAPTNTGTGQKTRNLMVFVQDRQGGPWRAAYSPRAARATGPLAKGVDVPDVADVVPPNDSSLTLPPGRLPAAHADMLSKGRRSSWIRLFQLNTMVTHRYKSVLESREVYTKLGWKGDYTPMASSYPVYAARTTTGGALVWYAVDFKTAGRNPGKATDLVWKDAAWGDLHKPFVGRSDVHSWFQGLERQELVAYIPPRGKGKIQVIAERWSPITLRGR